MNPEQTYMGMDPAKPGSDETATCIVSWNGQTFNAHNVKITTMEDRQAMPRFNRDVPKWVSGTMRGSAVIWLKPVILSRKQRLRRRRLLRRRMGDPKLMLAIHKSVEAQTMERITAKGAAMEQRLEVPVFLNRFTRLGLKLTAKDLEKESNYKAEMRRHIQRGNRNS